MQVTAQRLWTYYKEILFLRKMCHGKCQKTKIRKEQLPRKDLLPLSVGSKMMSYEYSV